MLISYVLFIMPVIAALSALLYLPVWRIRRRRIGRRSPLYHLARFALLAYALSLFYLTLLWGFFLSFPPEHYFLNLQPFAWVQETYAMGAKKMAGQLLLNIAMFVPYGLLLPLIFPKLRRWFWAGTAVLCTTLFIETVQYFIGRSADVDDVIMNTIGGLLGYALFALLRRLFHRQRWWNSLA